MWLFCVLCLSVFAVQSVGLWWSSGWIFLSRLHHHSLSSDLHLLSYLVGLLLLSYILLAMHHMQIQREDRGSRPPGKSPVAIGFLRNTDTDPPWEAIGPLGPQKAIGPLGSSRSNWTPWVQLPLKRGPYGPLWNMLITKIQGPPDGISWICACAWIWRLLQDTLAQVLIDCDFNSWLLDQWVSKSHDLAIMMFIDFQLTMSIN